MTARRITVLALALTLAAWAAVTWPLPRYVRTAIPNSSLNPHDQPPRYMIPGDHLQLLYRFWLFGDLLKGHSPLGKNVYEFNRHNDDERHLPGAYYLPFSLVHVIGAEGFGTPFGWNMTGFVSLWLTYLFTALIVRFYTKDPWRILIFSALAVLFPYRYHALLGGSPTGFAMVWPPMVVFGLEWAIRERRTAGGLLAGLGLFLNIISDLQLFFFTFLLAVAWGAVLFTLRWRGERQRFFTAVVQGVRALWPVAIGLVAAYAYSRHLARYIAGSEHMAEGRSMREVALYSPTLRNLLSLNIVENDHGVYMGYAWMVLALAAGLFVLGRAVRGGAWKPLCVAAAWAVLLFGLYALALGANGPRGGALYVLARRLLPPLQMIRQPARFLTLAPTLIPVMLAAVSAPLFLHLKQRTGRIVLGVFAAVMTIEYARHTQAELCLLDPEQGAYAAVRKDHERRSDTPVRAMAIPLWPGDSHWSSLYQYYSTLYRIRMLNGYSPVVEQDYYRDVFERFRSMNAGVISDDQLDALLAWDIRYVLLHEDAFPEIVSPFPVAHTLNRLAGHPRLDMLARDGRVWAFRILETARPDAAPALLDCPVRFPSRRYNPERHPRNAGARVRDETGIDRGFVKLNEDHPSTYIARTSLVGQEEVFWLMRVRGHGKLAVRAQGDDVDWESDVHSVRSDEWTWIAVSARELPDYSVGHVTVQWVDGDLHIDYVCFTTAPSPFTTVTISPACFYRAGRTEPETGAVFVEPDRDVMGRIFYGPRLPFEAGPYRVELRYESDAPEGAFLGTWVIELPEHTIYQSVPVHAGETVAALDLELTDPVPVVFSFHFAAEHPVRLEAVRVERME